MTLDPQLSDLRRVTYYFVNGDIAHNIMRMGDVARMVATILKLHHTPGINPHTGEKTKVVYSIVVSTFKLSQAYWWSTPDLGMSGQAIGARMIEIQRSETVFFDAALAPYADEQDTYGDDTAEAEAAQTLPQADEAALASVRAYWARVIEIGQQTRLDNYSLGKVLHAGIVVGTDGTILSEIDEQPTEVDLPPPCLFH